MKRLHVHFTVKDLDASIRFYSQLFASEPSVRRETMPSGCSTTRG